MSKVKKSFIEKVICFGTVETRFYTYFCDGRVDYCAWASFRDPGVYMVYRLRKPGAGDLQEFRPPFEIVGLFDVHGNRY